MCDCDKSNVCFNLISVFFVIKREMASNTIDLEGEDVRTHGLSIAEFVRDFDENSSALLTSDDIESIFENVPDESEKLDNNVRIDDQNVMRIVPEEIDSGSCDSGSECDEKSEADVSGEMCTANNDQKSLYHLHTLPDHERETYKCEYCDKVYYRKASLSDHVKQKHVRLTPFICPECGEGFTQPGKLTKHGTVHTNKRNFFCDVCLRTYKRKCALTAHRKRCGVSS